MTNPHFPLPSFSIINGEIPSRPNGVRPDIDPFPRLGNIFDPVVTNSLTPAPESLDDVARYGRYYHPASSHYPNKSGAVNCDYCGKSNLIVCIGYKTKDLCLTCTDKILDRNRQPTFDFPRPPNPPYPPNPLNPPNPHPVFFPSNLNPHDYFN